MSVVRLRPPAWRVLVVEPDAATASGQCRFLARVPGFAPVGVARSATEADRLIRTLRPNLLLLELDLPDAGGIALLRGVRARGEAVEAIVLTGAAGSAAVRAALQLGVLDYVLKPFEPARLHKSLGLFARRMALLAGSGLDQEQVDRVCTNGPNACRWLPRDLSVHRLELVRTVLAGMAAPATAAAVAAGAGVARVTARRYLEYLVTVGEATVEQVADGPGRPRKTYATPRGAAAAAVAAAAPAASAPLSATTASAA